MTELHPFQEEGIRLIYQMRGRALLADEMGLGKTIQALAWIRRIPKRRPVIIITPSSMKYTWQAEAAMHFGMKTDVLEGHYRPGRSSRVFGDILILNYEILASWLKFLVALKAQCVIWDEIHYCKNLSAKRTKASIELAKRIPSKIGLSGTPLTNRPIELWSILRILRPDIFPSYQEFAWRYCKPRYTHWGWVFDGAERLKELHRTLRQCMIRRRKEEVLPELPNKMRKVIKFRLPSYAEYDQAEDHFLSWLRTMSPSRANRAKGAAALVKVGYLLRLAAKLKLEWTEKWIDEFFISHPGKKLVAMTMHTFIIDHLSQRFPNAVIVDGRVTGRKRTDTVRQFQSNRRINLFLGNWRAAGIGITLTASQDIIALDLPWTPGDLLQGEDRIHRIGQKEKVTVYYLIALRTIEEKLIRILQKKSDVLDAILNGRRGPKDLDIFGALLSDMRKGL